MSFIKTGDGKIVSIIDSDSLTDEQKKAVQDMPKIDLSKQSSEEKAVEKKDAAC